MATEDTQGQPETTESAATTAPAPESTQGQTVGGATQEAEAEWTPDKLPEKERESFSKWADRTKAEYHRQEITRAGNWIAQLPAEDRERIKKDPLLLKRLEAQLDEARRFASGGVGPTNGSTAHPTPPEDSLDKRASKLASQFFSDPKEAEANKAWALALLREAREAAKEEILGEIDGKIETKQRDLSRKEIIAELTEVTQLPVWTDEKKGPEFEGRFRRRLDALEKSGKKFSPLAEAKALEAEMFPAPVKVSQPKPKPSFGDVSSGGVAATVGSDPLEIFNQKLRAAGVNPNEWERIG